NLKRLSGASPWPPARRGISLRSSLFGASGFIQPTAMIVRHAKQFAPERHFKTPAICIVPGQGFALKAAESSGFLAPHDRR
ncbi:hypothetical protein, partial [Thalassolituus alkanivorans]|uniref:hypothetical protein n=1 Tax=Thalassolituus alkanivorans TaxID=2881055 RepID=UPI001E33C4EA